MINQFICIVDSGNCFMVEFAVFQFFDIDIEWCCVVILCNDIRRDVLCYIGAVVNYYVCINDVELMDCGYVVDDCEVVN